MRENILSIVMVTFFIVAVLGSSSLVKKDKRGVAIASPMSSIHADLEATKKKLRKKIGYHPENILRLQGQDVRAMLKEPDLVRQDFPTVVWQYRNEACVLDIYFAARDEDVSAAPIVHYEIRAREETQDDDTQQATCMHELAQNRNGLRMVDVSAIYKRP